MDHASDYEGLMSYHWAQCSDDEVAQTVYDLGTSLRRAQEWRRDHALNALWRIEPRPWQFSRDTRELPVRAAKAAIETVQADICGRQKIKPMVVTDGAEWSVRRKAKKTTKFLDGVLASPHDNYDDAWALMSDVFFDAAAWGTGVVHVTSDENGVVLQRVMQHELFVDPLAAQYGDPKDLFWIRIISRDEVLSWYDDEEDADLIKAIRDAPRADRDEIWNPDGDHEVIKGDSRMVDMIKVVEAWYLDPEGEGRHVMALENNVTILDEDYERDCFPFVFLTWTKSRARFWGVSLVDEVRDLENELNRSFIRIQDSIHLRSGRRVYYEQGAVNPDDLEGNETEAIIAVEDMSKVPVVEQPPPVSRAEFQWMEQMRSLVLELPGISLQQATAKKEAGLESGRAIQYASEIGTRRQGDRLKAWESAWIRLSYLILDECKYLYEDDKSFSTTWRGKEFLKTIDWSDCVMDDYKYIMQIMPSNRLPTEPAGRIGFIEQLYNSQIISAPTFRRLSELPDLEAEFDRENAEFEYIEDLVDRMLDAETPKELAEAYEAPEPFFTDISAVLVQVAQSYWRRSGSAPPRELEPAPQVHEGNQHQHRASTGCCSGGSDGRSAPDGAPQQGV